MALNTITDTWRVARGLVSYPASVLHWATMKLSLGVYEWHPMSIFDKDDIDFKMALFIQGQPFQDFNKDLIVDVWKRAKLRACVDQGLLEWDYFVKSLEEADRSDVFIPELISGDFRKVDPDILDQYKAKGSRIIKRDNRSETDLHHAVKCVTDELLARHQKVNCGVVVLNPSDRFDHIMANVNELFQGPDILEVPIYLLSQNSLTWRLPTGRHRIFLNPKVYKQWCSILPIGQAAYVTTTGLKWNLVMQRLEFGGTISTSNQLGEQREVTLECDRPVIFSMGLPIKA